MRQILALSFLLPCLTFAQAPDFGGKEQIAKMEKLTFMVGRWEGDALVVDTVGVNEKTWLDDSGHPHSDALRIIERFQRPSIGRMDVQITIDDSKTYLRPWTVKFSWELLPDTELLDWVCENNKYFDIIPKE